MLAAGPGSPGTAAVVVSRRTGVSAEQALSLARELSAALARRVSVPLSPDAAQKRLAALKRDATACAGRLPCLGALGKDLGVDLVVGMNVSQIEKDRSVYFEAVATDDARRLAKQSFLMPARGTMPAQAVKDFVAAVAAALTAEPVAVVPTEPARVSEAPLLAATLDPAPAPAQAPVATVKASSPGQSSLGVRQLAWAPAAAGVALAGGGTLLMLRAKGRADALAGQTSGLLPPLTASQATAWTAAGQSEQTVGLVLVGAGAAALVAAGAMALFGAEPERVSVGLLVEPGGAAVGAFGAF